MEAFLRLLKRWGLHWFSIYQDLDLKKAADAAYRQEADTSPHVATMRALLTNDVLALANDPVAGWALRWRLKRNVGDIERKFIIQSVGTKFNIWFIPLFIVSAYLLIGMEAVGFLLPEWAAVARNLPTDIRTIFIYIALFMFSAITTDLAMRILEDRLLSAIISTTAYLLVVVVPGGRDLYCKEWFKWTIVGATGLFVTIVSSRRATGNSIEAFFIRKQRNATFIGQATALRNQLQEPTNRLLDMIDDHEEVETTWKMIFGTSKLSSNLQMHNFFMKEDVGDVLAALNCCIPQEERFITKARRLHPRHGLLVSISLTWLFGEGQHTYPPGPKLFMAAVTLVTLAFAVGPFYNFAFVMGTAVVWGWRCFLRILFPALSPYQSVRDVLKIFGSLVSSGLLDAPYSVALLATNFKIFDSRAAVIGLTFMETVLVLTISDAIGPLALYWAEKCGWVEKPVRRRRCDGPQVSQHSARTKLSC